MKYLEVREISVARDGLYLAASYPADGLYITQYDADPIAVVVGRVWRLPRNSSELIKETDGEKPQESEEAKTARLLAEWERDPTPLPEWGNGLSAELMSRASVPPDATALRRWALEQAMQWMVSGGAIEDSGKEVGLYALAEGILKWVLQLG